MRNDTSPQSSPKTLQSPPPHSPLTSPHPTPQPKQTPIYLGNSTSVAQPALDFAAKLVDNLTPNTPSPLQTRRLFLIQRNTYATSLSLLPPSSPPTSAHPIPPSLHRLRNQPNPTQQPNNEPVAAHPNRHTHTPTHYYTHPAHNHHVRILHPQASRRA
ncbi:hypothetical protein J1614_011350 [Plenodomus biglobosus]|nr:hypothetical protein J1614_011350 [Plenodomus biglobosus]